MALLTPEMLVHLNEHDDLFQEAYSVDGECRDVEEYFLEYEDEDGPGSMYVNVCSDLEIEPIAPWGEPQVTWTLPLDEARKLHEYLHHHRPGGYQHVHDSLLEAIQETSR